ncbi:hypothetical protein I4U23_027033 [Adineta vaga]|nr:hypothetical protein I4U23_027033 [Adineta vaga]
MMIFCSCRECDLLGYIHKFRSTEEIKQMTADDIRNTIITEINIATNHLYAKFIQGKTNCELHRMLDDL